MDFFSLGQQLKNAREAREISLETAETTLKIRIQVLRAFEGGNFHIADASSVQIRGFIRNYARFAGLDEELFLQQYDTCVESEKRQRRRQRKRTTQQTADVAAKRATETHPTVGERPQRPRRGNQRGARLLNFLLIVLVGAVAVAVIGFVAIQLLDQAGDTSIDPDGSDNNILQALPATRTLTPLPSRTPLRTATLEPRAVQNYNDEPVFVTIETRQRTWLRIVADGAEVFAGMLRPNESILEYRAINDILISASNANALIITYNGQPQASFGGRGQHVDISFRPEGDVEISAGGDFDPTPEFSPTPIDTPIPIASTLLAEQTASATPEITAESLEGDDAPVASITAETSGADAIATLPANAEATVTVTPTVEAVVDRASPTVTANPTEPPLEPTATFASDLPPRITPTSEIPTKPPG